MGGILCPRGQAGCSGGAERGPGGDLGWEVGRADGWIRGWMDRSMDGWVGGWTDGRTDGWMDGWMHLPTFPSPTPSLQGGAC